MAKKFSDSRNESNRKTEGDSNEHSQRGGPGSRVQQRRNLLKTISGGSVLAAGGLFPNQWAKPVIQTVLLPAHAETSPNGEDGTTTTTPGNGTTTTTTPGNGTQCSDLDRSDVSILVGSCTPTLSGSGLTFAIAELVCNNCNINVTVSNLQDTDDIDYSGTSNCPGGQCPSNPSGGVLEASFNVTANADQTAIIEINGSDCITITYDGANCGQASADFDCGGNGNCN